MWLIIALCYCILCWLIVAGLTRTTCWAQAAAEHGGQVSPGGHLIVTSGLVVFAPLLLPIVMVFVAWGVCKEVHEILVLKRAVRTFRAYEFVKMNYLYLDAEVRECFALHTPPLLKLQFDLIGDYRLKPEPVEVHDRFFLSADGQTLASICAVVDTGGVSFISVLEDGTSVCTVGCENPHPERSTEPGDFVWTAYLPGTSVAELFAHHLKNLQDLCASNQTHVLRFQKEQFREIVTYDQRVQCRWRYRHGGLDQEPPPPDFGSLRLTGSGQLGCPEHAPLAT